MDESTKIVLKEWNDETYHYESNGQTISTRQIARSMTPENFTKLFDCFINVGGKGFVEGKEIGLQLRFTHRTLQRLAICFALGVIVGLSEQERSDPRNQTALETAKKLAQMIESGELPMGLYI